MTRATRVLRAVEPAQVPSYVGDASFALHRPKSTTALFARCSLPAQAFGAIGDPARIVFSGSPQEGFVIRAARPEDKSSLKVNYQTGRSIYVSVGAGRVHCPTEPRPSVKLRLHTVDGEIRLGGPPEDWISGTGNFATQPPPPPPPSVVRLSRHPEMGLTAAPPPPPPPDRMQEAAELQHQLAAKLDEARAVRDKLESLTGLKFSVTREFRVILSTNGAPANGH